MTYSLRLVRSSTIKQYLRSRNIRTYATISSDQSREPCMSSVSVSLEKRGKYFNFNWPGLSKTETDEHLCLFGNMPGLIREDMKAPCVQTNPHVLLIGGRNYEAFYHAATGLPENVDGSMIKTEMQDDGMFKLTIPKVKGRQLKKNKANKFTIILTYLGFRLIPSVIMTCARPYIVMRLCPWWFDSITVCKKVTPKSLHVSCMPGRIKMAEVVPTKGVSVSLNIPELNIEDVKSFVKSDVFFIEGKTKSVHYITGIRLPEFFETKHSMIKTEKQDGMFKITLPNAKEKTSIFSSIITNFVSKRLCSVHGNKGWSSRMVTRLTGLVFEWAGPITRWTKNSPDEIEIEFPVSGVSEDHINLKVDVKNRLILIVKDNNNDICYKLCQELPRCGNFEKAVFKATLDAGLVTVNVKNFQKEELVVGFN